MRDLQKDLEICNKATPGTWKRNEKPSFGDWWVYSGGQHICLLPADKKGTHYGEMFKTNAEFIAQAREGWPHAIGRAIKAEAEVEQLQALLEKYNAKCAVCDHVSEIMRLHKVVEAARDVVGFGACHDENSLWSIKALQNTVENYEGWKKEGER